MGVGVDYKYFGYTTDNGVVYQVRLSTLTGALGALLGFLAMDKTKPMIPKGWKMRYALFVDPLTGNRKKLPVGALTGTIWTGAATELDYPIIGSDDAVTYSVTLTVGERASKPHDVYSA